MRCPPVDRQQDRIRRHAEDYKIGLVASFFDEVEELMVNLDEDFKRYMTRLGREEGRAEGREEGISEGKAEQRSATVAILANCIVRFME